MCYGFCICLGFVVVQLTLQVLYVFGKLKLNFGAICLLLLDVVVSLSLGEVHLVLLVKPVFLVISNADLSF